jgi:hypothetical protein
LAFAFGADFFFAFFDTPLSFAGLAGGSTFFGPSTAAVIALVVCVVALGSFGRLVAVLASRCARRCASFGPIVAIVVLLDSVPLLRAGRQIRVAALRWYAPFVVPILLVGERQIDFPSCHRSNPFGHPGSGSDVLVKTMQRQRGYVQRTGSASFGSSFVAGFGCGIAIGGSFGRVGKIIHT